MANKKLRPAFKIHGGKYYLSNWVIEHFPPGYQEMVYIEPFSGAASVLLNKEPSIMESIGDTNLGIIQILRALRDEPDVFIRKLKRINYTEKTFIRAKNRAELNNYKDYMDHAITEFIMRRMSRGGLKKSFAWSERTRGGQPGDVNAWSTIIKELPLIADRIKDVQIFHKKAAEVIKAFNESDFLCYADPPYDPAVRSAVDSYEEDDMTTEQHVDFLDLMESYRGYAIISGYPSMVYKRKLAEWRCVKKSMPNHASQQQTKSRKIECLWMNYDANGKLLVGKTPKKPKPQ